jgi:ribulose-5-phosphate 4-epimerase/fuculose-1-phosphate aldolase
MSAGNLKVVQKTDPVWEAKVHLAAALRLAVRDELEEGIDNHFTVMVPGYTDRFMISPLGCITGKLARVT